MKKMTAVCIYMMIASAMWGAILRVNSDPAALAEFMSVQEAYNAAANGDTLLVESNQQSNDQIVPYKTLTITGPGRIQITRISGDATHISGTYIRGEQTANNPVKIYGSNSTISGCYCAAYFTVRTDSILFYHNWAGKLDDRSSSGSKVYNSKLGRYRDVSPDHGFIRNSVIDNLGELNNTHLYNNIIFSVNPDTLAASIDYVIQHNIFCCPCPPGSGLDDPSLNNVFDVDPNTIFTYEGGFNDYRLIPGCVAEGAGVNGEDCGMFGGPCPFPGDDFANRPFIIPKVHSLDVTRPDMTQDILHIEFEAKTHPRPE